MNEYCCIRVIARIKIVIKNPIFTSFKKSAQNVEIELNHKLFNSIWPVLYLNIISIFCNLISITVKIFSNLFPQKYPFSRRNIPFSAEISLLKKIILENKRFKRIEVKVTFVGKKKYKSILPEFQKSYIILYYYKLRSTFYISWKKFSKMKNHKISHSLEMEKKK